MINAPQMVGWSTAYGWFGGAGFAWLILAFLLPETAEYQGSRAYLNPEGYRNMAWIGGLIIFTTGMISAVSLHHHIPTLHVQESSPYEKFRLHKLGREIVETLSNRSWLMLFAAGLVFALYVGLHSNTDRYYDLYFWQWVPDHVQVFPIVHMAVAMSCGVLAYPVTRGRDKKRTAIGLFLLSIVLGPLPVGLRLLDPMFSATLFPANGTDLLWWILLLHSSFSYFARCPLVFILIGSMGADIVEESQRTTGRRSEGLLTAGPALAQKNDQRKRRIRCGDAAVGVWLLNGASERGINAGADASSSHVSCCALFDPSLDFNLSGEQVHDYAPGSRAGHSEPWLC